MRAEVPAYSERAKLGYDYLYGHYNTVNIYVEDTASRVAWEIYLSRLLEGTAKITRIFQEGGKKAVVERWRSLKSDSSRKRVFVVDGDLDILLGGGGSEKGLFCLDAYCFENLLVCSEAIIEAAWEYDGNHEKSEVADGLRISEILLSVRNAFVPLFVMYAIAHEVELGEETVKYSVARLLKADGMSVCKTAVSKRIRDLRAKTVRKVGWSEYRKYRQRVLGFLGSLNCPETCVSGKDYIFPVIHGVLTKRFSCKERRGQLAVRLARNCSLERGNNLKSAILEILRKPG